MKKLVPFIVILGIIVTTMLAVIPDYQKSQRPFNKLASFAKTKGFAVGILLADGSSKASAATELLKVEQIMKRKINVKYYEGKEAMQLSAELQVRRPGFIVMDGDGNLAGKEEGPLDATKLTAIMTNLHTH
ncbi:MAG: hypothetical protein C0603_06755 [Denitrovibrio sp.]|nr:MAG: hypothetical protein C0603_06755 [Denitrovibrio sp.]